MSDVTERERAWLEDVGMLVRLVRVRRGETQGELVAVAVVSRVTLGSVERADHPAVVLTYVRLARTLGLSLGELLAGAP